MRIFLLISFVTLTMLSCDPNKPESGTLQENRQKWESRGISAYRFQIQRYCYCPTDFVVPSIVRVDADTVVAVILEQTQLPPTEPLSYWMTIDELFDIAENAQATADAFEIKYDRFYGFPRYMKIDYSFNTIDDEILYEISGFAVDKGTN